MLQLYDKLLRFPLFQGMSYNDLTELVAHTKFDFAKFAVGEHLAQRGEMCRRLLFVTDGKLHVTTWADGGDYTVEEHIAAPCTLQLGRLFGLDQRFHATFTAETDTSVISLGKDEVSRLCTHFTIFRINLLNLLTTAAQKSANALWQRPPHTLEERLSHFFISHCLYAKGHKTFRIGMVRLAEELNDSRRDISNTLNDMQSKGLLTLHRQRIEIPLIEHLL